jgi:4-amino-4-deoxy-L-arabinose transferase-like glycosyltransferase
MKLRLIFTLLICLVSLSVCAAINFLYLPHATIFPDEQRYLGSAFRLAQTGEFWVGTDRAWEMPGTAIWFSIAVDPIGRDFSIIVIRTAQSLLLVLQSVLIGVTTQRIFADPQAAFIAAAITAFYPFFLFYQGLLLSETLFNTLLIAAFACLYWWRERGSRIDGALVATCFCFAAATMTKATLTILPPLLLAIAAFHGPQRVRRASCIFVVSSLLYACFMSPWWLRNYGLFGTFVPFSTGAGINLYIGNNPNNPAVGVDWVTDVEPDVVSRINAIPDELARQRAFVAAAVEYIAADPVAFLERMGKKFLRFWNIVPNAPAFSSRAYQVISAASFGPILLMAIIGAIHRRSRWVLMPIYALIVYFTIVHMVTIASLRYRLPLEPFIILLAAERLSRTRDWFSAPAR